MTIHYDSRSVLHLVDHQIYHERTKYIDVKLYFVRDIVKSREVKIMKLASMKILPMLELLEPKFKRCFELTYFLLEDKDNEVGARP